MSDNNESEEITIIRKMSVEAIVDKCSEVSTLIFNQPLLKKYLTEGTNFDKVQKEQLMVLFHAEQAASAFFVILAKLLGHEAAFFASIPFVLDYIINKICEISSKSSPEIKDLTDTLIKMMSKRINESLEDVKRKYG